MCGTELGFVTGLEDRQGQSLRLSRVLVHGKGSAQGQGSVPCTEIQNSQTRRAAEGNQSMGLRDHLENINSSLLMVCLKNPINVYTHVPGQHVYPQLMALSGSWNDLCITTEQTPSPPSFALFPHRAPPDLFKSHPNYSLPLTLQCK